MGGKFGELAFTLEKLFFLFICTILLINDPENWGMHSENPNEYLQKLSDDAIFDFMIEMIDLSSGKKLFNPDFGLIILSI